MCSTRLIISIIALLSACGREPGKTADKPATADQAQTPAEKSTAPLGQNPSQPALLVETLPTCTDSQEGWIVYLKPAQELEACEGGQWAVIDVKGKDGAKGADGKNGEVGTTGAAGPAAKPLVANIWSDPITSAYWFLGGSGDQTACTGDWRAPTAGEMGDASLHGIYAGLAAIIGSNATYDCAWSTGTGGLITGVNVKPGVTTCGGSHSLPYGVFCIHD